MKVIVTGAAGFIGSHVTRALLARGDEVVAVDRPGVSRYRISDIVGRISLVDLDLANDDGVRDLLARFRPDAAVHVAWYVDPKDYLVSRTNIEALVMTNRLVGRLFESGCRKLVGVGTCLEYARQDRARREDDPSDPESLYASCKYAAFLVLRALAKAFSAEFAWARIFHLYGPGEHSLRLTPWVYSSLTAGKPVDITQGDELRDHLHVADVASALATIAHGTVSGIVNVCSGTPVTLREVVSAISEIAGRPDLVRFGARPYRPDEVMNLTGEPSTLRALGWTPRFGLRDGLRDTLLRDHQALAKGTSK